MTAPLPAPGLAPDPVVVRDLDELTPAWLTAALRATGHDVTIHSLRHEPVGTGQMAASYRLRLEAERGPEARDFPTSLVVKLPPPNVDLGPAAGGAYRTEVAFYTQVASTVAVRVPTCYYQAFVEDDSTFVLLLEDLAPAYQGDQVSGCSPDEAGHALANLAGLHGPRWCDPALTELEWLVLPDEEGSELLGQVLRSATDTFCDRYMERLSPGDRELLHLVAEAIPAWIMGRSERFGLVHGDYRLDNLLFPMGGGSGVAAVDWQTVSLGLPARDVAYFLGTSLPIDERRHHEDDLVDIYHRALTGHGVAAYSLDDCMDDYRFGAIQGPLITVMGSTFSARTDRGDDMFMAMVSRSCAAVRDLGSLDLL